jgi:hypothetical protein
MPELRRAARTYDAYIGMTHKQTRSTARNARSSTGVQAAPLTAWIARGTCRTDAALDGERAELASERSALAIERAALAGEHAAHGGELVELVTEQAAALASVQRSGLTGERASDISL